MQVIASAGVLGQPETYKPPTVKNKITIWNESPACRNLDSRTSVTPNLKHEVVHTVQAFALVLKTILTCCVAQARGT